MDPSPAPAPTAPDAPAAGRRSLWDRSWRIALGLVCALLVAMWAGIFLGFFDRTPQGTMSDPTFAHGAAPICAATKAKLAALPKAFETTNHVDRADVVAQTNVDLRAMLVQLEAIAPTAGHDGEMVHEWLGDWSTYVGNREDYANRLRSDETARFYESPKSSPTEQISKPIDRFAYVNHMYSTDADGCDTPADMS